MFGNVTAGTEESFQLLHVRTIGRTLLPAFLAKLRQPVSYVPLFGWALVVMALAGSHGMAAESIESKAIRAVDWVKLFAATLWFVAILYLAFLRLTIPQRGTIEAAETLRFSPLALAGLGVVVVTGILSTDQIIANPAYLFESTWGRTLLFTLVSVAALLLLSIMHAWKLGRGVGMAPGPKLARAMRRATLLEGLLALAVTGATFMLVFGVLPAQLGDEQSGRSHAIGTGAEDTGITLAGDADPLFVTLQSVPNRAGHNRITVTVVDWREPESLHRTSARLEMTNELGEEQSILLQPEPEPVVMAGGNTGRAYSAVTEEPLSAGRWHVKVLLDRPSGEVLDASFVLPVSEDPLLILERADKALAEVTSARMTESLGGGGVAIVSDYEFVAPDRMHITLDSGFERIVIGHDLYERWPDEAWRKKRWPGGPFTFPMYSYAEIASEPKLLDIEEIDGQPHYRVQFVYEPTGTFYEVWADVDSYRTRKLTMMAPAHYMYWDYYDYDGELRIEAPLL